MGWFAPSYKYIAEVYNELYDIIAPVRASSNKTDGVIRLIGGGRIDFWTLEDERAGRSRKYKRVVIDEGAFTKPNMMSIWEQSIKPTLLDYSGRCIVASNTNGVDPDNFLYQICHDPKHGFIEYHAPSWANPLIPARLGHRGHNSGEWVWDESEEDYAARRQTVFDDLKAREHPMVFAQEYAADFIDWRGVAFFSLEKLLVNGAPVGFPDNCSTVFSTIDTGTKTGSANDGTACCYWATEAWVGGVFYPLLLLDWEYAQIEGAFLEVWLPTVFARLEFLSRSTRARMGSSGAVIEDKDSGQILLQQAANKGWPATGIDSALTALGKDGRAIAVSGHVYSGQVKIAQEAYDKVVEYKGTSRNHLISQVTGFRVGDKDAAKRADDLLDTFTYGVASALGNAEGF